MKTKLFSQNKFFKIALIVALLLNNNLFFAQNTCLTPLPITAGLYTVAAIDGTQVPQPVCSMNGAGATAGEWYTYTPTQNYLVTITTDLPQNICRDTRIQMYTGNCSNLVCFAGDDDSGVITCTATGYNYLSKIKIEVTAGTTYYIAFDNKWESNGFDFTLTEAVPIPNLCLNATTVTAGTTTVSALQPNGLDIPCSLNRTQAKWFKYIPTADYNVKITSDLPSNLCKNTNLSLVTGNCTTFSCLANDDDGGLLECNINNVLSNLSTLTYPVVAGSTYYIVWDNKWESTGFDFSITETPIVIPVKYTDVVLTSINTVAGVYNNCVVDMNNDRKDDIVSVASNNIKIHYQTTNNQFNVVNFPVATTNRLPTWSIAAGDYNRDGFNDLMYGNGSGTTFMKSANDGTTYVNDTPGQYIFCQRTNFVDINNDGKLDAFSCHDIQPNVYYINDGLGNFTYNQCGVTPGSYSLGTLSSGGNYASIWTDYDNDGDSDMFISKCSGPPSELHRNDGNGVFTDVSIAAKVNFQPVDSWSSAVNDFDNDGDMDILVGTNGTITSRLLRNDLDKTNNVEEEFVNVTSGSGFDTSTNSNRDYVSYDFDNDTKIDILSSGNKIMFNQGNMVFAPTFYNSMGVGAIGDLNNDGFLDIQIDNTIKFAIPNGNNWLKIATKGVLSNINGIGARIEIYGAWGKQIRDIRSGEGFEFMSTLNTHFGLGTATAIEKIIIKWPSGTVDQILNPSINQTLLLTEGDNVLASDNFTLLNFKISPNPVNDILQFNFSSQNNETLTAEIVDLTGKIVSKSSVINNAVDVKNLTSGFYFLVLKNSENKQFTEKFIKN